MPRSSNFLFVDRVSNRRPLRTMRSNRLRGRGARLYDMIVPRDFDYEVTFRMRGQVPSRYVNQTCTRRGLIPQTDLIGAELFMHCFDRRNPERGIRTNYHVQVTQVEDVSEESSSFEEVDLDQESEMVSQLFDTSFE